MSSDGTSLSRLDDNLLWIVDYYGALEYYMNYFGHSKEEFESNMMYQDCCYSKINQIIQCLIRIQEHYPEIYNEYFSDAMRGARKTRSVFTHEYERTAPGLVWNAMVDDLPRIVSIAQELHQRMSGSDLVGSKNRKHWLFRRKRR